MSAPTIKHYIIIIDSPNIIDKNILQKFVDIYGDSEPIPFEDYWMHGRLRIRISTIAPPLDDPDFFPMRVKLESASSIPYDYSRRKDTVYLSLDDVARMVYSPSDATDIHTKDK